MSKFLLPNRKYFYIWNKYFIYVLIITQNKKIIINKIIKINIIIRKIIIRIIRKIVNNKIINIINIINKYKSVYIL